MDAVLLARLQFGMTVMFHFLFPSITIGLGWLIAYMVWQGVRTGDAMWDRLSHYWIRIFAILFAAGVATGIAMEFQFGTNWSAYSRFVGDIFGSPLAAEGIFAFFLESVFMGVLLFGKKRVSKKFYAVSALLVAIGTLMSGFWIIVANSWMQTPTAYEITGEGVMMRAELTNFWAAVFNPSTLPRYFHTITSSLLTASFFIGGVGAYYLVKGKHEDFARRCVAIGVVAGAVFSVGMLGLGHIHAVQVAETQPVKIAAFEALFTTQEGAPLSIIGIPDVENRTLKMAITIPKMLSLLIDFNPNAEVKGLEAFPQEEWPPISVVFYTYHLMFMLGMFFIFITWVGVILREKRYQNKLFLRAFMLSAPLPLVTIQFGWMAAEFGRQPWVVFGVLKTEDAVSVVVPPGQILFTFILFALIYALLLGLVGFVIKRKIDRGPVEGAETDASEKQLGQEEVSA